MRKSKVFDLRSGLEVIHRDAERTNADCVMCREEGSDKKRTALYCGLPLDFIKSTGVVFEHDNALTQIEMANLFISAYARTKDIEIADKDTCLWYKNERPKLRLDFLKNINNGMNSEAIRFILAQEYFKELYIYQNLGAGVFEDPEIERSKYYMEKLDNVLQNETCHPYEGLFTISAQLEVDKKKYNHFSSKKYAYLNEAYLSQIVNSISHEKTYINTRIEELGVDMVEDVLNDKIAVARLHDRIAFLEYNIRNGKRVNKDEIPEHFEGLEEERVLASARSLWEAVQEAKEQNQDMQR